MVLCEKAIRRLRAHLNRESKTKQFIEKNRILNKQVDFLQKQVTELSKIHPEEPVPIYDERLDREISEYLQRIVCFKREDLPTCPKHFK